MLWPRLFVLSFRIVEENLEIEAFEFLKKENLFKDSSSFTKKKVFQKLLLLLWNTFHFQFCDWASPARSNGSYWHRSLYWSHQFAILSDTLYALLVFSLRILGILFRNSLLECSLVMFSSAVWIPDSGTLHRQSICRGVCKFGVKNKSYQTF